MTDKYTFTIFTPTYNRSISLNKLYRSLKIQTFKDFEWIIVDDGSKDNTKEVVEKFMNDNILNIRYYYQTNKGKQFAYNEAVKHAKGRLFICIDDDDYYIDYGLEIIRNEWENIKNSNDYAGLGFLSAYSNGEIIGKKYPKDIFDSNHIEIYSKYKLKGDKVLVFKTKVLKRYPFPIVQAERFITEAIIYNRIAQKYKFRYVNKVIEIKEYRQDGLSNNIIKIKKKYPLGYILYYNEYLGCKVRLKDKLIAAIWYTIFCQYIGKKNYIKESKKPLLILIALPLTKVYKIIKRIDWIPNSYDNNKQS
jgi:glycosyltransferase involved in cell wall biosynthesis